MSILFKFTQYICGFFAYILSVIAFPLTCLSCGKTTYGIPLCGHCKKEFFYTITQKGSRCRLCGTILISEKESCLECRTVDSHSNSAKASILKDIDGVFPIHFYILWKKELLFAWKTANTRSLSPIFARLIFKVLQKEYPDLPIVPVPPRPGKIKKKGWDQIDELCRYLHGFYGVHIEKILVRLSKDQQKKLTRAERLFYVGKTYTLTSWAKKHKENLPKTVVLLDDIMTTGATLETCARALKDGGVECVYAVTLFYC